MSHFGSIFMLLFIITDVLAHFSVHLFIYLFIHFLVFIYLCTYLLIYSYVIFWGDVITKSRGAALDFYVEAAAQPAPRLTCLALHIAFTLNRNQRRKKLFAYKPLLVGQCGQNKPCFHDDI